MTVHKRASTRSHAVPNTAEIAEGLVSVLLPVRNGMPYLPQAIDSLLLQSYPCLEIIVVDDRSSDETQQYLRSRSDSRLKWVATDAGSGSGIANALNLGLAHSRGEFVARQDADDISRPDRIGRQVEYLRKNPSVAVVAAQADYIDQAGIPTENSWTRDVRRLHDPASSSEQIADLLPLTCCLIHGSVVIRRSVLQRVGAYNREYEWAEDYDLWLRLLPEHRIVKIPERLYGYRIHSEQISDHRPREQVRYSIRAKLAYLRRTRTELPRPATVCVQGDGSGAQLYREMLSEFGLMEPDPEHGRRLGKRDGIYKSLAGSDQSGCDLFIVTDFALIEPLEFFLASSASGLWLRVGSFLVRQR